MGADLKGQREAIEIIRALPEEVKGALSHHLRNSLMVILGEVQLENHYCDNCSLRHLNQIESSAKHLLADLEMFGL